MNAFARTTCILLVLLVAPSGQGVATEVQFHGVWFEHWLGDTFFDGYRSPNYTQKWDIPASANHLHGNLPVNPKAVKFGAPIGLGDALRQFDIDEPFILVVAYWDQVDDTVKSWVNAQVVTVTPEQWRRLWHPVTRADLEKLDAVVKDPALSIEQTRAMAQLIKSRAPFSEAVITVNPKIDPSQRRLQCSLAFRAFFEHLAPHEKPQRQAAPAVWGKAIPQILSGPREFQARP